MFNYWMQTYSGLSFDLLNIDLDKIIIGDIAHSLSMLCRYGGHCQNFYSVAEHSIYVSKYSIHSLEGLMHDATEAYSQDLIYPMKQLLPSYKEIEDNLARAIAKKFNLIYPWPEDVLIADKRLLGSERVQCMSKCENEWYHIGDPYPELKIRFLTPYEAEVEFLKLFELSYRG